MPGGNIPRLSRRMTTLPAHTVVSVSMDGNQTTSLSEWPDYCFTIITDHGSDEHHRRSPGCPFFALSSQPKPRAPRKTARASKASRLSTQSNATLASEAPEAPSMAETTFATAAGDDTVLTTTSTMTAGGKKGRAKKGTTAKGRKTKAKKEEPGPEAEPEPQVEEVEAPVEEVKEPELASSPVAHKPKKATRGKKRGSDAVDESTMTATSEAPTRKKRATKKGSVAVESSVIEPPEDSEMTDVPAPKKANIRQKRAPSKTRTTKKASIKADSSIVSTASAQDFPGAFPSDDEIERQLEADLERPLTDDEDITADSDSERKKKAKSKDTKAKKAAEKKSEDYAMFDPTPVEPAEEELDGELDALREEMQVDEPQPEPQPSPEPEQLKVPKKGRKAGTRKASKQTKSKKAKDPEPEPAEVPVELEEPEAPAVRDISWGSTDTVVKKSEQEQERLSSQANSRGRESMASQVPSEIDELAEDAIDLVEPSPQPQPQPQKKRGRPSKASLEVKKSLEFVDVPLEEPKKRGPGRPSKAASLQRETSVDVKIGPAKVEEPLTQRGRPSKTASHQDDSVDVIEPPTEVDEPPKKRGRGRPSKQAQAQAQAQEKGAPPVKAADPPVKRPRGRPPKKSSVESRLAEADAQAQLQQEEMDAKTRAQHEDSDPENEDLEIYEEPALSPIKESPAVPSSVVSQQYAQAPSTPGHGPSPSASARQAAISPSQSPQSSDAENQPPSSKPSASVTTKRIALAPMSATPMRTSPSKRNIMAKLQSATPWKAVDLDAVFGSPDKENAGVLMKGKELTSPEKGMTVEEWIYFNAGEAERMLKEECEGMVSNFESEGGKAMGVLEGLVVE